MSALNDLAEMVEALTGPDREVDAEIAIAIRWPPLGPMIKHWIHDWPAGLAKTDREGWVQLANYGGDSWKVPAYTTSIDTALTLVPEGCTQPSDIVREALRRLGEKFGLHVSHWPLITPYPGYLARFVTAAALRSRARSRVQGEG